VLSEVGGQNGHLSTQIFGDWSTLFLTVMALFLHSSPRRLAGEKKSTSYNHKTTMWVSHEYYLNPEFHKILSGAF
jgi:hypothetical protein